MSMCTKCLTGGIRGLPIALGTPGGNDIDMAHRHLRPCVSWLYPSPALFQVSKIVCDTFVKETEGGKEEGEREEEEKI